MEGLCPRVGQLDELSCNDTPLHRERETIISVCCTVEREGRGEREEGCPASAFSCPHTRLCSALHYWSEPSIEYRDQIEMGH